MSGIAKLCDESVATAGLRMHYHKCGRPVFEDGKCKIHCESSVAARRKKSEDDYRRKMQPELIRHKKLSAYPKLLGLLIQSQGSIGGDWRDRRDALLATLQNLEDETP